MLQHVGSDADVEANTKLKGLEEKLAQVGQNISLRASKVKQTNINGEEDEEGLQPDGDAEYGMQHLRLTEGNGDLQPNAI